jgi:hypothetical protein
VVAEDGTKLLYRGSTAITGIDQQGPRKIAARFFVFVWNSFRPGEQEMLGAFQERPRRHRLFATASPVVGKKTSLTFPPAASHRSR